MNVKIYNKLQSIIKQNPYILGDKQALKVILQGTFNVRLDNYEFGDVTDMVDRIDQAVMHQYFAKVWQPKTKKYKYSGLSIVDEVNTLDAESVVDLGCGFNEFKGKIDNIVGVDPYNSNADISSSINDYTPEEKHDVAICLGSVNFGSASDILLQLNHIVHNVVKPGGLIFFRGNPGKMHESEDAAWIDFFEWTPEFIASAARMFGCIPAIIRQDTDRLYFVWKLNA